MAKFRHIVAGVLLAALASVLWAAPPPDPSKEDYTVGPRDKLHIKLWGEDNMEAEVTVSGQGTITYFFLGEVQVAGLTVAQIREKLTKLLQNGYYKNPVVMVRIVEYKSKEVQIQGQVEKPGTYALETNYTTLVRLISLAGGTKENRGKYAYIYRGGLALLKAEEAKKAPPPAPSPSPAPPNNNSSASSPSGTNDSTADKEKSEKEKKEKKDKGEKKPPANATPPPPPAKEEVPSALRGQGREEVDLRRLLDEGDLSQDVAIYPGDFVFIGSVKSEETTKNYVWVEGAVRYPKPVEWQPGLTVLQAIIQAGGFTEVASPNRTTITRIGPNGTQTVIRVKDIQRGKLPDVALFPGDRITVPESIF